MIRNLDTAALHKQFRSAEPFPWICIDDFLEPEFARQVARSYPDFQRAEELGFSFNAVNEKRKVQITDRAKFPDPVRALADACATESFRNQLSEITGIRNLLWDDTFAGGGMHQTATSGRLDVHVDFNRLETSGLYRRANLLLYLNEEWDESWGGKLELWDREVKRCHHSFTPKFNRCVVFETSDISYHGVTPLSCPPGKSRNSFALYFYTEQAPAYALHGDHTTIFRARPDEPLRRFVLMPAERVQKRVFQLASRVTRKATSLLKSKH